VLTILLPPSEGKAPGGGRTGWEVDSGRFGEALGPSRTAVARALARAGGGDARLLGVGGEALARSRAANVALVGAPTLPAWRRFTGVVWDHLDVGSLHGTARRRANRSVVVVSALAGLSALTDPLPDHRLKLSASLPPMGRLSTWWRDELSAELDRVLARRLVVDLLPQEHSAAWRGDPAGHDRRRVTFVGRDGRIAGHTAKAAKGLLARALLQSEDPADVLATWTHPDVSLVVESGRSAPAPTPLAEAVTAVLARLAPGDVVTYGEVAAEAGYPGRARAVGTLLAGSGGTLPWWRVVNASGRLVPGQEAEQARRLQAEGVDVTGTRVRFPRRHGAGVGRETGP
jgi:alkylated DNA nucleotide flippase Atl1